MEATKIKAVLFDMGGVVKKGEREKRHKRLCELLNIKYEDFKELFKKHEYELVTGKMSVAEFSRIVEKQFDVRNMEKKYEKSARELFVVDQIVISTVKRLKKRYVIGMVSNTDELLCRINREYGLYEMFDPVILSCEVGLKKPGREIFEFALEKLGLDAEECIFIDDREKNLEDPRNMGFHVIHFQSAAQLKGELEKMGLKWKA